MGSWIQQFNSCPHRGECRAPGRSGICVAQEHRLPRLKGNWAHWVKLRHEVWGLRVQGGWRDGESTLIGGCQPLVDSLDILRFLPAQHLQGAYQTHVSQAHPQGQS